MGFLGLKVNFPEVGVSEAFQRGLRGLQRLAGKLHWGFIGVI